MRYPWGCIYEMYERTENYGLVIGSSCTPRSLKKRNKRAGHEKLNSLIEQKKECWHNKRVFRDNSLHCYSALIKPQSRTILFNEWIKGFFGKKKREKVLVTELTKSEWKSCIKWEIIKSNLKLYIHYIFYPSAVSFFQTNFIFKFRYVYKCFTSLYEHPKTSKYIPLE